MENNKPLYYSDYLGPLCDHIGIGSEQCKAQLTCHNCTESAIKDHGLITGSHEGWRTIVGPEENIVLFLLKYGIRV